MLLQIIAEVLDLCRCQAGQLYRADARRDMFADVLPVLSDRGAFALFGFDSPNPALRGLRDRGTLRWRDVDPTLHVNLDLRVIGVRVSFEFEVLKAPLAVAVRIADHPSL